MTQPKKEVATHAGPRDKNFHFTWETFDKKNPRLKLMFIVHVSVIAPPHLLVGVVTEDAIVEEVSCRQNTVYAAKIQFSQKGNVINARSSRI
jgi:hypothetical protein